MLFPSYSFIFGFLPLALVGYFLACRIGDRAAAGWLVLCSFAFYAMWNPPYVLILIGSFCFNFLIGWSILREKAQRGKVVWASCGIGADLGLLIAYKYLAAWTGYDFGLILPLGISFFTFTQIGYLVDCLGGKGKDLTFLNFVVFVTFFPHLIAGPILHIRDIAPQLANFRSKNITENITVGATYFILGLAKKVLLADTLAGAVDHGFANPGTLGFAESWAAALCYTLQIYFDFSGYSDMAIGLACMFGIRFPLNFNSPYKAASIIEFWQRWHMTLTRYLTLLLFNPLALAIARRGYKRFAITTALPIVYTMAIAGVWHGAGWTFLIFGLLHAGYLIVNHAWRRWGFALPVVAAVAMTHLGVIAALVFFRSNSAHAALALFKGMSGLRGLGHGLSPVEMAQIVAGYFIVWALPNTQQIMVRYSPVLEKVSPARWPVVEWKPSPLWTAAAFLLMICSLVALPQATVFLYFQF